MRKFLLALAFVLMPALALATTTYIGGLGSCTSATSGTTCVLTVSSTLNAQNVVTVHIGADNVGTTAGTSTEVASVTDSGGNTYSRACEYRYSEGVTGDAAIVGIWLARATTQLTSGVGTITVTFANTITTKAVAAGEWGVDDGNTLQLAGTCQTENLNAGDAGALVISGLPSKEYVFIRASAWEATSGTTSVATTNYTAFAAAQASTGTAATSISLASERRILTGTGDTSNPTLTAFGTEGASIYVALEECTPGVNCTGDAVLAKPRPPIIVQ